MPRVYYTDKSRAVLDELLFYNDAEQQVPYELIFDYDTYILNDKV